MFKELESLPGLGVEFDLGNAFTDWPKEKIDTAVKRVLVELDRKIKDNRVRGGSIEDDRAYIDLSDDELTNVQVGGGRKHGLYFLVDDSVRD